MNESTLPMIEIPEPFTASLAQAVELEASDIHLVPGHTPVYRVHGELRESSNPPVNEEAVRQFIRAVSSEDLLSKLIAAKNADFSFESHIGDISHRFRANAFFADEKVSICLRLVPTSIPAYEWAEFPVTLGDRLAALTDGLVIITGMTGSGKTTTLAMIVNEINQRGGLRIITVEEPIEYRFPKANHSIVTQREVGTDVLRFSDGLRSGLRQDPDIILVGEIRDRETAQMALSAAETGHLVFTTLHTRDAKGTISRYADLFPQDVQSDIRVQLALSLRCVVCQKLLPDVKAGNKRHLALEILWNISPVATAIRQGKLESIDNYLVTRRDDGMQSFDESIRQLWQSKKITRETVERNARDPGVIR